MKKALLLFAALLLILTGCSAQGETGYSRISTPSQTEESEPQPASSNRPEPASSSEPEPVSEEPEPVSEEPEPVSESSQPEESSRQEPEDSEGELPEEPSGPDEPGESQESEPAIESGPGEDEPASSEEEESQEPPAQEPELPDCFPENLPPEADALAYVTAEGSYGELQFYKKGENGFELLLTCDAFVGREGIGEAHDWWTKTPAGLFPLRFAFGVSPDPGCPIGYTQVDETHYWVGDSDSPYYNRFVSTRDVPFQWTSYEHLIDYPTSYAYAIWIEHNSEQTPGNGSAFFLHCENGYPTAGCVAVGRDEMVFILRNLTLNTYIYIVE